MSTPTISRRAFATLFFSVVLPVAALAAPIEDSYALPGPFATTERTVLNGTKKMYRVYAPLGATLLMPIVTWGNGTGLGPKDYSGLMSHLASYGMVVVDSYNGNTGDGKVILDAALFLEKENARPASPLFGKIDTARVAAVGHSQGAAGVINAATRYLRSSFITTVIPVGKSPSYLFKDDSSLLTAPIFYVGGTKDVITPPKLAQKSYEATPAALPAALAVRVGAGHDEIRGNGGRERGYVTAWLMFQLFGDETAAAAFSGTHPEISSNSGWTSQETKNLP